ncbi:MAG TPA: hypothetical protein VFE90_16225 [Myxococcales bacterium]|nr:hypothetical protein [Myxococcales bacterium]
MRALALLLLIPGAALADGAFPSAHQILLQQSQPQGLRFGATLGLVFADGSGSNSRYVCEPYITGGPNVVLYAQTAGGALLALSSALGRSTDQGCSWSAIAPPAGAAWTDVFADARDPARVLGVASSASRTGVWLSADGGQTFPRQLLDTAETLESVESAATDPTVVYASTGSNGGPTPALFHTTDGGVSWARTALALATPVAVRIVAVSPKDPRTLWLRASYLSGAGDELLVSTDGGATLSSLLKSPQHQLTGFALGGDGTVFLSDGSPGVMVMAPGASAFTRLAGPHLLCLAVAGSSLLGCADGLQDPYDVGQSDDGGRTWRPLLSLANLLGPATCSQVQSACAADWQFQQTLFAAANRNLAGSCGCRAAAPGGWLAAAVLLAARAARRRRTRASTAARP